jgi:5-methylcytosine-specific restriction protein A
LALEHALLDAAAALAAQLEEARNDRSITTALEQVGDLRRIVDAIGAELAGDLSRRSATSEDSLARRLGDRSATDSIVRLAGIEPGEAADWCAAGEVIAERFTLLGESLPAQYAGLSGALRSALLSPRAVRKIAETLDTLAIRLPADSLVQVERLLLDCAQGLTAREVKRMCVQALDRFDPDGVEPREAELIARRGLQIFRARDGATRWVLTLDPLSEGLLTAALDARAAPSRRPAFEDLDAPADDLPADRRAQAQRRLDALVSMARDSLAHDDGQLAGRAVTMVVTIPLTTLESGLGAAWIDGVDTPISAGTARRLAADAKIIPAVLGTKSEPLDYGAAARLFSEAQRGAMALRDGGCIWCGAPPARCQAAHLSPWVLTRETNLENGALMCPADHARFDREGWHVEWRDGMPWLIPPPWLDAARTPRRGYRARLPELG